jgi:beta-galactosidase
MTQFSDADVTMFSNCDSVRLSIYDGDKSWTLPVPHEVGHMKYPPVTFKNVWNFWEAREYSYLQKNWQKVNMVAEGIIDGKVVCTTKRMPSRRSTKLRLYVDTLGKQLVADGSDFVVVVAEVTDDSGNVRRLAKENVVFSVEGEGEIIGDASINANPRAVEFGSAPVLIRSTRTAGKIRVKAHVEFEGTHAPTAAEVEFESIPALLPFCYTEDASSVATSAKSGKTSGGQRFTDEEKRKLLDEVEKQQTEFGTEN